MGKSDPMPPSWIPKSDRNRNSGAKKGCIRACSTIHRAHRKTHEGQSKKIQFLQVPRAEEMQGASSSDNLGHVQLQQLDAGPTVRRESVQSSLSTHLLGREPACWVVLQQSVDKVRQLGVHLEKHVTQVGAPEEVHKARQGRTRGTIALASSTPTSA